MNDRAASLDLASASALLARIVLITAVFILPLAMDLGNVEDTYYGAKARTLIILASALVGSGVLRIVTRRPPMRTALTAPALLFMAAAAAATALGVDPAFSLRGSALRHEGLFALWGYALLGVFTASDLRGQWWRRWRAALFASAAVVSVYAVAQNFGFQPIALDERRVGSIAAFATLSNPNWLGAYMVLILPATAAGLVQAPGRFPTAAFAALFAVEYWALLASYSVSGWLAGWGALLLFVILAPRPGPFTRQRLGLVIVIVALVTLAFFARSRATVPVELRIQSQLSDAVSLGSSAWAPRIVIWADTLPLIARRPLFGYGPDAFRLVFPQEWTEAKRRAMGPNPLIVDRAHNELLDLTVSTGLVGTVAVVWAFVMSLRALRRAARRGEVAAAGLAAGLIGYAVLMQVHFSTVNVAPIFWGMLGAGVALEADRGRTV